MRSIGILYFSAVGGTRLTAELLAELLYRKVGMTCGNMLENQVSMASVEDEEAHTLAAEAGLLVFCYPTYYLKPAPPMNLFAAGLKPFKSAKPCYIITTCELYSENSMRRLARILAAKGLAVRGWKALRAPGSDITAVLDARLVPWLYRFGRGFEAGLRAARDEIISAAVDENGPPSRLPPPRLYTPLTQLVQVTALNHFDRVKYRLRVLSERCTHCGICATDCPAGAIRMEKEGVRIEARLCILCCRCVHGCTELAIVLSDRLKDNRRIDAILLAGLKAKARASLGLGA